MCGIAGFVGPGSERDLRAMSDAMIHRGPDGSGSHIDARTASFWRTAGWPFWTSRAATSRCGTRTDRSASSSTVKSTTTSSLRKTLIANGHVFRSDHSDTEVLVHGYEEWGDELPLRLNGMFAFAIYDRPRRRLFISRDRFGKKPLYYSTRKGFLGFASELSALLKHPHVDSSIDEKSLRKYFAYSFIPAPNSLYRNVSSCPADIG